MTVVSADVIFRDAFRAPGDRSSRVKAKLRGLGFAPPTLRRAERPHAVVAPSGHVIRRFQRRHVASRIARELGPNFRVE